MRWGVDFVFLLVYPRSYYTPGEIHTGQEGDVVRRDHHGAHLQAAPLEENLLALRKRTKQKRTLRNNNYTKENRARSTLKTRGT